MQTKQAVYTWLREHPEDILSGEALAATLGVSRASIWKAVQSLRQEGVSIRSEAGKGYLLETSDTALTETSLLYELAQQGYAESMVEFFQRTPSTNLEAKQWALEGAPNGSLAVALSQEDGKGRNGRPFASPEGGIYMSVILRPDCSPQKAALITQAAAVSVYKAVEETCKIYLSIKWVNDLFYQGKKCCGILTEAGSQFENSALDYVVVGIGLNFETPLASYPSEVCETVTSLYPEADAPVSRAQLIAAIYSELMHLSVELKSASFMEIYRQNCFLLGQEITVLGSPAYTATAIDIEEDGGLKIQLTDGQTKILSFGEVRIKPIF